MFSHLSRELRDLRVSVVNSEFPLRVLDESSSLVEFSKSGPFPFYISSLNSHVEVTLKPPFPTQARRVGGSILSPLDRGSLDSFSTAGYGSTRPMKTTARKQASLDRASQEDFDPALTVTLAPSLDELPGRKSDEEMLAAARRRCSF